MESIDVVRFLGELTVLAGVAVMVIATIRPYRERQLLRRTEGVGLPAPDDVARALLRRRLFEDLGLGATLVICGVLVMTLAASLAPLLVAGTIAGALVIALVALVVQFLGVALGRRLSGAPDFGSGHNSARAADLPLASVARPWEEKYAAALSVVALAGAATYATYALVAPGGAVVDAALPVAGCAALLSLLAAVLLLVRRRRAPAILHGRPLLGDDVAQAWSDVLRAERLREPLQLASLVAGVAISVVLVAIIAAEPSFAANTGAVIAAAALVIALTAPTASVFWPADRYVVEQQWSQDISEQRST